MATKKISQLPVASALQNSDLLAVEQGGVAKSVTGTVLLAMLDGHGGIASTRYTAPVAPSLQGTLTLTFADGTTASIPIYNGAQGATGAQGEQGEQGAAFTYSDFTPEQLEALRGPQGERGFTGNSAQIWIKWSSVMPTSDADMGDIPDAWMGIYSAAFDEPPASYEDYAWYCIKGTPGAPGLQGETGARGSYIFQSNYPVRGSQYQLYFLLSDLIAPVSGATPQQGDMAIYGDNYYIFGGLPDGDKYYVGTGHSLNSAALPSGGTTGQVLGKASDNDFDVIWQDAGSGDYAVTYGSTSLSAMRQAETDGKTLKLTYNSRRYAVVESTGGLNDGSYTFVCVDDDGTTYWLKAEKASAITPTTTWTNGSSSGGGTTDYTDLTNKPSINSVTLSGNKTASDLGMIAAPSSPATGAFLVWDGSAWTAQTLSTWQGGSF